MPLSATSLKTRFQAQIAPGNDDEFYRILTEADERLLEGSKGHWTREKVVLTPDSNQLVVLDEVHSAIVACRLDDVPKGVRWEESEYYEEGVGELPIDGCRSKIVDQGLIDGVRTYKVCDENIESVYALVKFAPACEIGDGEDQLICPSKTALKLMMLSIIYEEANDLDRAMQFEMAAKKKLKDLEDSYRGIAKEIFTPSQYARIPRRARINLP